MRDPNEYANKFTFKLDSEGDGSEISHVTVYMNEKFDEGHVQWERGDPTPFKIKDDLTIELKDFKVDFTVVDELYMINVVASLYRKRFGCLPILEGHDPCRHFKKKLENSILQKAVRSLRPVLKGLRRTLTYITHSLDSLEKWAK